VLWQHRIADVAALAQEVLVQFVPDRATADQLAADDRGEECGRHPGVRHVVTAMLAFQ
jgi:hypothetical protein